MGIRSLLRPSIIRATADSLGIHALRFDYHQPSATLFLTLIHAPGQSPDSIQVPLGRPYTITEISELLQEMKVPGRFTPPELQGPAAHETPP